MEIRIESGNPPTAELLERCRVEGEKELQVASQKRDSQRRFNELVLHCVAFFGPALLLLSMMATGREAAFFGNAAFFLLMVNAPLMCMRRVSLAAGVIGWGLFFFHFFGTSTGTTDVFFAVYGVFVCVVGDLILGGRLDGRKLVVRNIERALATFDNIDVTSDQCVKVEEWCSHREVREYVKAVGRQGRLLIYGEYLAMRGWVERREKELGQTDADQRRQEACARLRDIALEG